jgi:hydroxymethylglutaryl-CoA synthase
MATIIDNHVGILAMEVYFPSSHVSQKDLEVDYKVSTGKFTKGLGQDNLAFVGDREDINSISLTVVNNLLEKYEIPREKIGRLEIGTESLVDKSKSTKTVLMSLFESVGNVDIEGTTTINACYGGTAALINALNWVDSASYDGRYAIVVAADIAVYAEGPARPTSGCGAVAMLIGRDAPLPIDLVTRASYACNQWDFFKPDPHSEYPVVNGKYSQSCYLMAFDSCYRKYIERQKTRRNRVVGSKTADHMLFHSPYNKLVQKTVQRMFYLDSLSGHIEIDPSLEKWQNIPTDKTYTDRELEGLLKDLAQPLYESKVAPCCVLSKEVGNTYTAAVYLNLANMVSSFGAGLTGKSATLFSYGSGTMASMFEIRPRQPTGNSNASAAETFSLERMQAVLGLQERLAARKNPCTPAQFTKALSAREKAHACAPFTPTYPPTVVSKGTFYLKDVSENHERTYARRPLYDPTPDFVETDDERFATAAQNKAVGLRASVQRSGSFVWPGGKPLIRVVVTGTI